MAVKAELGDEFTEKKFREMKQFDAAAVADAVAKQNAADEPAPVEPEVPAGDDVETPAADDMTSPPMDDMTSPPM
jgi:hypothetical protein